MSKPFEEISAHPDVGPEFTGVSRYKRHTSRPTGYEPLKKIPPHTNKEKLYTSFVLIYLVFVILIIIIGFNFESRVLNSPFGFPFLVLSIVFGWFLTEWAYLKYLGSKTNREQNTYLAILLLLFLTLILWWITHEYLQTDTFALAIAAIGLIASIFLLITYPEYWDLLLIGVVVFGIGIWISSQIRSSNI